MHSSWLMIISLAILSPTLGFARKFHQQHSTGHQIQKQIDDGIGKFGIDLHKYLAKHSYGDGHNILVSPISVYFTLALAHLGTAGETRDELKAVMGLPVDEELALRSHHVLGELYRHLQHSENANISMFNGLFVQTGNIIKDTYKQQIKKYYDSYITSVDFSRSDATDAINRWFQMKTSGKISHFYDQIISQDVKFLLANALTFNSIWDHPFQPQDTKIESFYGDDGHHEQVSMLHKTDVLPYYKAENKYEVVGLPLKNGEHYVYIVLPNGSANLIDVIDGFAYEHVHEIVSHATKQTVDIKLPKMSVKTHEQIKDILRTMGIHKLFETPDLGNMMSQTKLRVSQIWHNVEWTVDENGIDASAGTTQEYRIYDEFVPSNDDVKEFHVQRPYMFFVHHPSTKSVLYYGCVHKVTGN